MVSCSHGGRQKYSIFPLELLFHYSNFPFKICFKGSPESSKTKKGYWTFQLQYFICTYVNWTFQLVYSLTVKSRLVAHFQILRKLMKEKFHAYVLWPLAKKTYKLNSRLIFCSQLYDISKLWMPSHRGLKLDGAIDDFAKPEGRKLVILLHNSTYITLAPH